MPHVTHHGRVVEVAATQKRVFDKIVSGATIIGVPGDHRYGKHKKFHYLVDGQKVMEKTIQPLIDKKLLTYNPANYEEHRLVPSTKYQMAVWWAWFELLGSEEEADKKSVPMRPGSGPKDLVYQLWLAGKLESDAGVRLKAAILEANNA